MKKLDSLYEYLLATKLYRKKQCFSWVEDPKVIPCSDTTSVAGGTPGIVIARIQYQAIIDIEKFDHNGVNVEMLIAHVSSWLQENDDEFTDEHNTVFDTDIEDTDYATISITIQFEEGIELIEDAGGTITFNGKQWSVANAIIHIAEEGDVFRDEDEASEVENAGA